MTVPASVKQLLDKQKVAYTVSIENTVTERSSDAIENIYQQKLRRSGVVKSIILQDKDGSLQVIIPANCLLDIDELNQQLGRKLRAMSDIDLQKFYGKHGLSTVPALPKLGGMPTVIDQRVLETDFVLLDSGAEDILQVTRQGFATMAAETSISDICVPLAELENRYGSIQNDEADIFEAVKNFTTLRIKQRLQETLELPPLPQTAQKIIKLRVNPDADISELADIVELDASLSAQVVSWAASPYYSAPGKIKSIHDAIVRVLGFDMVLNLALGLALGKTLEIPKDAPKGATPYWQQSVYTAATVEGLVTAIPREKRPGFGMAYLSGLLHNFGWLILAEVFPPYFSTISRCIEANSHVPPHLVELHLLGVTREQLSSWLMRSWSMPEEVVIALRYQNTEEHAQVEHAEYAKLILVAQRLLQQRGIGLGPQLEVPEHIYKELHLDPVKAQQAVDAIMSSTDELNDIAHQLAH